MKSKVRLYYLITIAFVVAASFVVLVNLAGAENGPLRNDLKIPGKIGGAGSFFEITNSSYLNINLQSSEVVKLDLESIPKMVRMTIDPVTSASSTQITITGFQPFKTYFKYEDNYHNLTEFFTDADGSYAFIQDLSRSHLVFFQEIKSTKFIEDNSIGGDCSSIGVWDDATKTCRLTTNVNETVQIDSNGITIDGNGYSIIGSNTGDGVFVSQKTGIVIKNLNVSNFFDGVGLYGSQTNVVNNVSTVNNAYGIRLENSEGNVIEDNILETNSNFNLYLQGGFARNNLIRNNTVTGGGRGMYLNFAGVQNAIENNIITGTRLDGISILFTPEVTIRGNKITGITTQNKSGIYIGRRTSGTTYNITITENTISGNNWGILLDTYPIPLNPPEKIAVYHNNIVSNQIGVVGGYPLELSFNAEGNYWSHVTQPCFRTGDTSDINSIKDSHPYCRENGWFPNQPPVLLNLSQFALDGTTPINEGSTTTGFAVTFKATGNDPDNDQVKVQVELKEYDQLFDEQGLIESNFVNSGTEVVLQKQNLAEGQYHWRTRAIDSLGNKSDWQEFGSAGNIDFTVIKRTVEIAVILAETSDVQHILSPVTAQPCKLIPEKTYPSGHGKEYFEDLAFCVKDYYLENSYGSVNVSTTVFDNEGGWYQLASNTANYVRNERQFYKDAIAEWESLSGRSQNEFDALVVVHSGSSAQTAETSTHLLTQAFHGKDSTLDTFPNKIVIAEDDPFGMWAHEIGHVLGEILIPAPDQTIVPDLYNMGLYGGDLLEIFTHEGQWDVMAAGSKNGGFLNRQGTDPPHMSSYTKEFLRWLSYNILPKSAYGTYPIEALEQKHLGDTVFRYNLQENTNDGASTPYYILETRNKTLTSTTWDTSIPHDALIAYYVNPLGFPKYGYISTAAGSVPANQCRTLNIPRGADLNIGGIFNDYDNLISISAISEISSSNYTINAQIQPINENNFTGKFKAFFLRPTAKLSKSSCVFQATAAIGDEQVKNGSKFFASNIAYSQRPITEVNPPRFLVAYAPNAIKISVILFIFISFLLWKLKRYKGTGFLNRRGVRIPLFVLFSLIIAGLLIVIFTSFYLLGIWNRGLFSDNAFMSQTVLASDFSSVQTTAAIGNEQIKNGSELPVYPSERITSNPPLISPVAYTPSAIKISVGLLILISFLLWRLKRYKGNGFLSKKGVRIPLFVLFAIIVVGILTVLYFSFSLLQGFKKATGVYPFSIKDFVPKIFLSPDLQPTRSPSLIPKTFPDLDLHAITPDGKHIGVNYQTGQYENQIPGAIVSGDNQGSPEWILLPESTNAKLYVSSHDNKSFLDANPNIAAQIGDTNDSYEVYARFIDPQTGIFTSQTLANQTISPTQNIVYQTQGTTDISVSPGIVDSQPPATTISISGTQGQNNWYTSDLQVALSANDDSGVLKTEYSLDNGQNWIQYAQPFVATQEGIRVVLFRSYDIVGNIESAKSQEIKIDKTAPKTVANISGTKGLHDWYITDTTLVLESQDQVSGTVATYYSLDNDQTRSLYSNPIVITEEGTNNIQYYSQDAAGNLESMKSLQISIDKTPPKTLISTFGTQGQAGWYKSDVTIALSSKDEKSGILKTQISLDGGNTFGIYTTPFVISSEGLNSIQYFSTDNAGNIEPIQNKIVKIDKTAPESEIFFDKNTQTLKVEGIDNLTPTHQIYQAGGILTISDEAGHTIIITLDELKQNGKEIKAVIKSIQYNNESIIEFPKVELNYEWSLNKQTGQIKELEQKIKVKDDFEVHAKYNQKKNETSVGVNKKDEKKIEKTIPGVAIIKLITKSGSLDFKF